MAYKVIILYRLYMPSYFLGTFTEYPFSKQIALSVAGALKCTYHGKGYLFMLMFSVRFYRSFSSTVLAFL